MLLQSSLLQSTIVSYQIAFQSHKQFLVQTFGEQVQLLPPSVQHMSALIAHCFQSNLAASTTRTLISSLSFIFKLGDFSDVTQHFIINKMFQGYQKCKPSMDARLPITPLILGKLVNALEHTTSSPFLRALLRAMFILAFCAFLRVGEITKTGNANQHFLKFGDICVSQDVRVRQFIDVNIPHFKHSKSHHTTLRLQENTSPPYLCPYQAVVRYLDLRKHALNHFSLFWMVSQLPVIILHNRCKQHYLSVILIYIIIIHIVFESERHLQLLPRVLQNYKSRLWVDGTLMHFGNTLESQLYNYKNFLHPDLEDRGFRSITNTYFYYHTVRGCWSFSLFYCVLVWGVNKTASFWLGN